MAETGWNFHMNPPLEYTSDPLFYYTELVHSIKASTQCEKEAKLLADCRKKPEGKLVKPEKCHSLASALIDCYQVVKIVPPSCKEVFDSTMKCFTNPSANCDRQLESYLSCKPKVN